MYTSILQLFSDIDLQRFSKSLSKSNKTLIFFLFIYKLNYYRVGKIN